MATSSPESASNGRTRVSRAESQLLRKAILDLSGIGQAMKERMLRIARGQRVKVKMPDYQGVEYLSGDQDTRSGHFDECDASDTLPVCVARGAVGQSNHLSLDNSRSQSSNLWFGSYCGLDSTDNSSQYSTSQCISEQGCYCLSDGGVSPTSSTCTDLDGNRLQQPVQGTGGFNPDHEMMPCWTSESPIEHHYGRDLSQITRSQGVTEPTNGCVAWDDATGEATTGSTQSSWATAGCPQCSAVSGRTHELPNTRGVGESAWCEWETQQLCPRLDTQSPWSPIQHQSLTTVETAGGSQADTPPYKVHDGSFVSAATRMHTGINIACDVSRRGEMSRDVSEEVGNGPIIATSTPNRQQQRSLCIVHPTNRDCGQHNTISANAGAMESVDLDSTPDYAIANSQSLSQTLYCHGSACTTSYGSHTGCFHIWRGALDAIHKVFGKVRKGLHR
eukprot:scpid62908/ scgid27619/ 